MNENNGLTGTGWIASRRPVTISRRVVAGCPIPATADQRIPLRIECDLILEIQPKIRRFVGVNNVAGIRRCQPLQGGLNVGKNRVVNLNGWRARNASGAP